MLKSVAHHAIIGVCLVIIGLWSGLCYFSPVCQQYTLPSFSDVLSSIATQALVYLPKLLFILLLFALFKLVITIVVTHLKKSQKDDDEPSAWGKHKVFRAFMWTLFVLISISTLFENVGTLFTSVGLIGFGLTFALQKPIINWVGWINIMLTGIYREGDRIMMGNVRGDVKKITVMNTELYALLETSDIRSGKVTTVPNELVLTGDVVNFTKESNYILDEMIIRITFESNYRKAMEILCDITIERIKKNKDAYKKRLMKKQKELSHFLEQLLNEQPKDKKTEELLDQQAIKLQKQQEELKSAFADLEEEFKPKIRVELDTSSIALAVQFTTPYDQIRRNRTEINLAFLDAIKSHSDIAIAVPHLCIVTKNPTVNELLEEAHIPVIK